MSQSLSQLADDLLQRAELQAYKVVENEAPGPDRDLKKLRLQFQILFPQLAEWQGDMLVTLHWQRVALTGLIHFPRSEMPDSIKTQLERTTCQAEQSFMRILQAIRNLVRYDTLTPVQQNLVDRHLTRIPFPESTDVESRYRVP